MSLEDKTILITGAGQRIGRHLAISLARLGADIAIHYGHSKREAEQVAAEIQDLGRKAWLVQADLGDPRAAAGMIPTLLAKTRLDAIIHNAAIFEPLTWSGASLESWQHHLDINLTSPFFINQAFAASYQGKETGRILHLLDWRALRPGMDHIPYTISKSALAALTKSLAAALAPKITVNGIALGAILPPSDGGAPKDILKSIPAGRWADLDEVTRTVVFLLDGPAFITGEIIHLDGGRHLI